MPALLGVGVYEPSAEATQSITDNCYSSLWLQGFMKSADRDF